MRRNIRERLRRVAAQVMTTKIQAAAMAVAVAAVAVRVVAVAAPRPAQPILRAAETDDRDRPPLWHDR